MVCGRCGCDVVQIDENGNKIIHTKEECDSFNKSGNIGCLLVIAIVVGFLAYCLKVSG